MDTEQLIPFYEGFSIGLSLIMAIGLQNAFVIKQGILNNQIFIVVLTCVLIDSILISIGVAGFGAIVSSSYILLAITKYGGAIFLAYYGVKSLKRVFSEEILYVSNSDDKISFKYAILTTLSVSILNPHLYLDTCVLIGSIGTQFEPYDRVYFALGAIFASFIWFFSLGYGARFLLPIFQTPISWKILDIIIGITMISISIYLVMWDPIN